MEFISPTKGHMSFEAVFNEIVSYMAEDPEAQYKLIIGTDSHTKDEICFVTAIVIYRLHKGGRYFYSKRIERKMPSLRQRIFFETALSLGVASRLAEMLSKNGHENIDLEIHLDVGQSGQTKELIKEIVGMVTGSGFDAKIKPESYGASSVADKHSK